MVRKMKKKGILIKIINQDSEYEYFYMFQILDEKKYFRNIVNAEKYIKDKNCIYKYSEKYIDSESFLNLLEDKQIF